MLEHLQNRRSPQTELVEQLEDHLNQALIEEFSGYRIINDRITPITNKSEIDSISSSMQTPFVEINAHIDTALGHLSDRENYDPRNSIKESISAIETLCKKICGDQNATLGSALRIIEKNQMVQIHPKLKTALENLYAYTNDASGIRHGLEANKISANCDDAKLMLVICSSLVNYLVAKLNYTN